VSIYARFFWPLFVAFVILVWYFLFATGWTTERRLNYTIRRAQQHSSMDSYLDDLAHMRDILSSYRARVAGLAGVVRSPDLSGVEDAEAVVLHYLEYGTAHSTDEYRARDRLRQFFDSYQLPSLSVLDAVQRRGAKMLLWVVGLAAALAALCRMRRLEL
jgi:hypothetical protein